jgi:hypothetical protein
MRKLIVILIIITVPFLSSQAFAQLKAWSKLFIFDGAYAIVSGEETSNTLDGYAFSLGFEQLSRKGQWSGGIGLMYLNSQDTNDETQEQLNYSSYPISLYGKYFAGIPGLSAYLQAGFGIQFSNVEYTGKAGYYSGGADSGLTLNLGAGAPVFLNERMFLNIAYNLVWMENSYYQDGLVHMFKLGLGFQYD